VTGKTPRAEKAIANLRRICEKDGGQGVVFRIRDTGIGIAPEHLEQIFEPFWQVDPAQRSVNGGTGLGLSVVRALARLLGGEIVVESQVRQGSTFTLRLPDRAEAGGAG
jgi:signal transduction histidine kinase